MKNVLWVASLAITLAACGPPPNPVIDMEGKDPVKANRDMAACQHETSDVFAWGNPMAKCMRAKGYAVIGVY